MCSPRSTRDRYNNEPRYCNKNDTTPKATNFNYQPRICIRLRGIGTICGSYNMSFLFYHLLFYFSLVIHMNLLFLFSSISAFSINDILL